MISEEHLPATLTVPPMTDDEFVAFCENYPDCFVEVTADGEVIIMPPNYSLTSARGSNIVVALGTWAKRDGRGIATDSCGGFVLPNGARRAPDAAWTSRTKLATLTPSQTEGFWRLGPDFVIELRSTHDRLRTIRAKMAEWIDNGAKLGWMIDPKTRTVEVYRPNLPVEIVSNVQEIVGGSPVDGFVLDLEEIWNPLG